MHGLVAKGTHPSKHPPVLHDTRLRDGRLKSDHCGGTGCTLLSRTGDNWRNSRACVSDARGDRDRRNHRDESEREDYDDLWRNTIHPFLDLPANFRNLKPIQNIFKDLCCYLICVDVRDGLVVKLAQVLYSRVSVVFDSSLYLSLVSLLDDL